MPFSLESCTLLSALKLYILNFELRTYCNFYEKQPVLVYFIKVMLNL